MKGIMKTLCKAYWEYRSARSKVIGTNCHPCKTVSIQFSAAGIIVSRQEPKLSLASPISQPLYFPQIKCPIWLNLAELDWK